MPLHTFTKDLQRVRIVNERHPLVGCEAAFVRRVTRSDEGWFRVEDDLPAELQSPFPDDARRLHLIVLFPDDCEAVR